MKKMKNISRYAALGLMVLLISSCAQKFKVEKPEIGVIAYTHDVIIAGQQEVFTAEVVADRAVIWSGASLSDYDKYISAPSNDNIGFAMTIEYDKINGVYVGSRSVTYDEAGTYKVVIVASNIGDLGETIETVTKELSVTVEPAPEE